MTVRPSFTGGTVHLGLMGEEVLTGTPIPPPTASSNVAVTWPPATARRKRSSNVTKTCRNLFCGKNSYRIIPVVSSSTVSFFGLLRVPLADGERGKGEGGRRKTQFHDP